MMSTFIRRIIVNPCYGIERFRELPLNLLHVFSGRVSKGGGRVKKEGPFLYDNRQTHLI